MFVMKNAKIVKEGICLYDHTVPYEVRIIEWHTLYGSGDYEDAPDISNDKAITCYYVCFESLTEKGEFSHCGGGYLTIEESVRAVEKTSVVEWIGNTEG